MQRTVKEADVQQLFRRWVTAKADDTDLIAEGGRGRFARGLTLKIILSAEAANILVHLILGAFRLLPYPLSQALAVGSFVTVLVSAAVGYVVTVGIGTAIYELSVNRNEFRRLSSTDPLSGHLNRRAIFESIVRGRCRGTFLLFDIDHFKHVNDRFGHLAGDDVICGIAERLVTCALPYGGAVGRMGGEEFAVFLPNVDAQSALKVAALARLSIGSPEIRTRVGHISVTVSGGVAEYDPAGSVDDAYSRCDRALYRAKSAGRNCVYAEDDLGEVDSGMPAVIEKTSLRNLLLPLVCATNPPNAGREASDRVIPARAFAG